MMRFCSMCGKEKECDVAGHCASCAEDWLARKEELRKEGFYKNMNKLRQPRYFNFLRNEE